MEFQINIFSMKSSKKVNLKSRSFSNTLTIVTCFDGGFQKKPFCDCHLFLQHFESQKGFFFNLIAALENDWMKELGVE